MDIENNDGPLLSDKDVSDMVVRLALTAIEVRKALADAEEQIKEFFDSPEDFDASDQAVYELGFANGMRELLVLITGYMKDRISEPAPTL